MNRIEKHQNEEKVWSRWVLNHSSDEEDEEKVWSRWVLQNSSDCKTWKGKNLTGVIKDEYLGQWESRWTSKLGTTGNSPINCLKPHSYIKKLINNKVTRLNHEDWTKNGHKHTKMLLGRKQAKTVKNLNTTLITNRLDYRTAVHLITGHCVLNKLCIKAR